MIKSNLKELLDRKRIPIRQFARKIDYRFESVRQLYHGTSKRIPVDLIELTCRELNVTVGELLTVEDDEPTDESKKDR